jgi:cytochrome c oxidase cbb3-type subunit III
VNRFLLTAAAIFLSPSLFLASQAATPGTPSQGANQPPAVAPIPSFQAYPTRPPADPAAIERGKTLFSVDCSFCHGSAAKGGEGGPNLVRSEIVLNDKHGEMIATVVQNGRPERGMPKFDLTAAQISDIADFIHSFSVGGRANRGLLTDPVVGNAKAGETFFNGAGKCSNCHSVTGDLAGIGSRLDPRNLQADFLTGGTWRGGRPANAPAPAVVPTVTVTLPNNEKVEGRLNSVDDFSVSLTDASGDFRTFSLGAAGTRVEIHNPVQVHMDMWRTLSDGEIHDLTAYLVTLK